MTRSVGVLRTGARYARWGFPWLGALAVSASIAYATTVAVTGGPAGSESTAPSIGLAISDEPQTSARVSHSSEDSDAGIACDTSGGRMLYVGLNTWVAAEPTLARCPDGVP
jgi:hypothetical protein